MKPPRLVAALALLLFCGGCAGGRHYHALIGAAAGAPAFLELRHSVRVAALHFPAGIYTLEAADDAGVFYRAPAKIRENSFSGPLLHDGGLYLNKSKRAALRGYVFWYGGLVHVGDLSRADYVLRD